MGLTHAVIGTGSVACSGLTDGNKDAALHALPALHTLSPPLRSASLLSHSSRAPYLARHGCHKPRETQLDISVVPSLEHSRTLGRGLLLFSVRGRPCLRGHAINGFSLPFAHFVVPIVIQTTVDARWRLALDMEALRALYEG